MEQVTLNLVARGIKFNTFSEGPPPPLIPVPKAAPSYRGLGLRAREFTASPSGYASYESIRNRIFRSERGRVALMMGGLVARLATGIVNPEAVCSGSTEKAYLDGLCVQWDGHPTSPAYWDDALTSQEVDSVCGVYEIETDGKQTKIVSYWPPQVVWWNSGLNVGYWTPACEEWFQSRLAEICTGDAQLHTQGGWKKILGIRAPSLNQANGRMAAAFLAENGTRMATDATVQQFIGSHDPGQISSDRFYFILRTQRPDSPTPEIAAVETANIPAKETNGVSKSTTEGKQPLTPDIQHLTRQYWDIRRKIAASALRGRAIERHLRDLHVKDPDIYLTTSGTRGIDTFQAFVF
ncbi:hypothetical protein DFH06DRAFT_976014 [Mycena polygramma]|nr:hypothetical protein DFH06DRAFT_976014 [Mycena polygramma]